MRAEKHILLVVNPIAGDSDKEHIIALVEQAAGRYGYLFHLYKTTGEKDREEIEDILYRINPQRVIVAGGDGTIGLVAQALYGKDHLLGIIPAGSANGMAVNFQLPPSLEAQVEIAFTGQCINMDTVFINGHLCLHIADLGLNAELIKNYEESGIRGKLGYFLQSIPTIFNSDYPYQFHIETESGSVVEEGILLAIANANKFGTGATINPDGKINDGKFEILIFRNWDFIEILKTLQENPQMSSDFVRIISTDRAVVTNKNAIPFQIDGEFMGKWDRLKVEIGEYQLPVAVPEEFLKLHELKPEK